jgi:hypothetical protein
MRAQVQFAAFAGDRPQDRPPARLAHGPSLDVVPGSDSRSLGKSTDKASCSEPFEIATSRVIDQAAHLLGLEFLLRVPRDIGEMFPGLTILMCLDG